MMKMVQDVKIVIKITKENLNYDKIKNEIFKKLLQTSPNEYKIQKRESQTFEYLIDE